MEAGPVPVAEYLQRVDILKDLTREEIETLFGGVMLRECARGTVFFTPEDTSSRLYFLKEGEVELYRLTASGKRLVTGRVGQGAVFGEMGLLEVGRKRIRVTNRAGLEETAHTEEAV